MSVPRVAKNVYAAQLAREAVILHLDTKRYYRLNATGAEVWKGIEAGDDREALAERLVREFTVELGVAAGEVARLLERLREAHLIE